MEMKDHTTKLVTIDDYDELFKLWNSTEQSRRALNPVDDSREGIARCLKQLRRGNNYGINKRIS